MRSHAVGAKLRLMTHPTRITLEMAYDGEAPAGQVLGANGRPQPFNGWLGLAAAIEAALPVPVGQHTPITAI